MMFEFEKIVTFPFKFTIPSLTQQFIENNSIYSYRLKFIKRFLYLILKNQKHLETIKILPKHDRILWINISAPSLGDTLMDLSSREMLRGRKVDLFTDKNNAELFINDFLFEKVFTEINQVDEFKYDLVIIDSYSTRSIKVKNNIAYKTPYVGMFGFYNGPEVNRVLFSFHQMNNLLGYVKSFDEINKLAKTSISISKKDQEIIKNLKLPSNFIAIAIGGEWSYRTYIKWDQVIEKLISQDKNVNIVLVGSQNAVDFSTRILENFSSYNIVSCISKFSFVQTTEIIRKAQILICCDGGLMHSANAVKTPIVPLFAGLTEQMQLTKLVMAFSLFDSKNVNNILVKDVLIKFNEAAIYVDNHP